MAASNMPIFQCLSAYTTETSSLCSLTILVAEECLHTSTSSLSNMMWRFRNYHTSNSGHEHLLTILIMKSIIMYGAPELEPH
ncbi:hypothetical protein KsCSTR_48040 [Candidatus Kuenenia stuttgartiensis]|uniref:Uncharacterized protein n=1 Tax=Kuenenia stuttgartiensis TaxID=174633 RepID=Q1PVT6_KUEST|nr:hypothetical protein KsCSTR_48040 [Candidatus Kuenenia stuttgartiensis]CAJ71336.1 unknown protein [Candidatus Kuenenia stuttgartiensis]